MQIQAGWDFGKDGPNISLARCRIDPVFPVREPGRVSAGHVTFEPGSRSAWHTHPLVETLIITSGLAGFDARAGRSKRSGPAM